MCRAIVENLVGYQNRTNVCSLCDIAHKSGHFFFQSIMILPLNVRLFHLSQYLGLMVAKLLAMDKSN